MATVLYDDGNHQCLSFGDLVTGDGVQSNQFLVIHGEHEALIDPGGDLTFTALSMEISKHIRLQYLDYLVASHQDPDIIASLSSRCHGGLFPAVVALRATHLEMRD